MGGIIFFRRRQLCRIPCHWLCRLPGLSEQETSPCPTITGVASDEDSPSVHMIMVDRRQALPAQHDVLDVLESLLVLQSPTRPLLLHFFSGQGRQYRVVLGKAW